MASVFVVVTKQAMLQI